MPPTPTKSEILLQMADAQMRSGKLIFEADALKNTGKLREAIIAYEQLVAELERELELTEANNLCYSASSMDVPPTVSQMVNALLTEADVFEALGEFEKAEKARDRAMKLSEKYLSAVDNAERHRQRASALIPQGRFNEALVALAEARDLFAKDGNKLLMATVTSATAGILEWLGDFERARAEVKRALELIGPALASGPVTLVDVAAKLAGGDLQKAEEIMRLIMVTADLKQTLARMNRRMGNFNEAEAQFREVFPLLPQNVAKPGIGFQIAAIRIEEGRYAEGLQEIESIAPYFTGLVRQRLGVLLSFKAEAMLGLGRNAEALALATQACGELENYHDADSLWKSEWRKGRALIKLGRPKEAMTAFVQAADTINWLRKAPLGYRLDSTYLKDKLPVFVDAIDVSATTGDGERACWLMELVKSRALTATLSTRVGSQPGANEFDLELDKLSSRLDALEYKSYAGDGTAEIEKERTRLHAERASLLERSRISDPRWRSLSEPLPFDVEKLLSSLDSRRQAALSLFMHDDDVTSVLLAGGICEVGRRTQLSQETRKALEAYHDNLQAESPDARLFDLSEALKVTADQIVPRALLEKAVSSKTLVVVPHGLLHLIPWAALKLGQRRLFEYVPVGVLPNLSCIMVLFSESSKTPRVALIGAPRYPVLSGIPALVLGPQEIAAIADTYQQHGTLIGKPYVLEEATEEHFWLLTQDKAATNGILHVVCHGDFVTGDPMSSGLLLSNGKVDAAELIRKRLPFDEIILSACATGQRPTEVQGVALTGDDIVGLPGALLEAGARSVLVSIPAARDDAAMQFMTTYHEHRVEGTPPLPALQKTQIDMLEGQVYEPALWVGFTAYGCQ